MQVANLRALGQPVNGSDRFPTVIFCTKVVLDVIQNVSWLCPEIKGSIVEGVLGFSAAAVMQECRVPVIESFLVSLLQYFEYL